MSFELGKVRHDAYFAKFEERRGIVEERIRAPRSSARAFSSA